VKIFAIDFGGSQVKVLLSGEAKYRKADSGDNANAFIGAFRLWESPQSRSRG
jgi:hypothetical protein